MSFASSLRESPPASEAAIASLRLASLLSYGRETHVDLGRLNVLIGPNGSGKSNFIEAIALLRAATTEIRPVIRAGGGIREWIWKGAPQGTASIEAIVAQPAPHQRLRHRIAIGSVDEELRIERESVEHELVRAAEAEPYLHYRFDGRRATINARDERRSLIPDSVLDDSSILAQRRDPEAFPALAVLSSTYERIRIYRNWSPDSVREPQRADARPDRLEEDFSNLGLFLNRFRLDVSARERMLSHLRDFYEGLTNFDVIAQAGFVQIFMTEGRFQIPATRLSDGTLRYLCLLAILLDPQPAALVCIEEPEVGLHPDILPKLADLLRDASTRMQLVITTHSDILIDALTETPESILVCEKHSGETSVERLNAADLAVWLEKYRLGQLWLRGEIGGVRW